MRTIVIWFFLLCGGIATVIATVGTAAVIGAGYSGDALAELTPLIVWAGFWALLAWGAFHVAAKRMKKPEGLPDREPGYDPTKSDRDVE
jgi:hypothetical protein